jgi:hypothetical protein
MEDRQRHAAFRDALASGDAQAAQAADPMAFAQLQKVGLEGQKTRTDIMGTQSAIEERDRKAAMDRDEATRKLQANIAETIKRDPRYAQYAQQEVDRKAKAGTINAFQVPVQTESLDEGVQGAPDQITTPQQAQTMANMAGVDAGKNAQALTETATTLRKEFESLPEVKNYSIMRTARANIENASVNGVGALNIVFAYMKALDPNSSVREGEAASARNAGGIPESIRSLYNRALGKDGLTDNLRRDFINEARKLEGNSRKSYDRAAQNYGRLASQSGIAPADVVFPYEELQQAPAGGVLTQTQVPEGNTSGGVRDVQFTVPPQGVVRREPPPKAVSIDQGLSEYDRLYGGKQ